MTDTTHDDLVKRICEEWVKDGRSEDCFWEGWPECPTPEDSLTPRMVIDRIEELEAKLGKAVEALMAWKHYNESDEEDHVSLMLNYGEAIEKTRATLAELTGGKDDNNYI
jgi:hypothetical protein